MSKRVTKVMRLFVLVVCPFIIAIHLLGFVATFSVKLSIPNSDPMIDIVNLVIGIIIGWSVVIGFVNFLLLICRGLLSAEVMIQSKIEQYDETKKIVVDKQ